MLRKSVCVAAALSMSMISAADDQGKFSGVMFGDLYLFDKHHDPAIQGKQGFWTRRMTLSYDRKIDAKMDMKLQFEARDAGDFETQTNMNAFIRDAWIRFKDGRDAWQVGVLPTPTWQVGDSILKARPIERSTMNLFRMASSRDRGVAFTTELDKAGQTQLQLMVGNGNGLRTGNGGTAAAYARLRHNANEKFTVVAYGDVQRRQNKELWKSAFIEGFYVTDKLKGGLSLIHQNRSRPNASDLKINAISLYVEGKLNSKASPFIRWDQLSEIIPDADRIDYYKLSPDGKPTLLMVGVRLRLHPNFEIVPNIANVSYRAANGQPKPKSATVFRITFNASF